MQILIFTMLIEISGSAYDGRVLTALKYSPYYVRPAIVRGQAARREELPFVVSIKLVTQRLGPERARWSSVCGGSIVAAGAVLTAAHCFEADDYFLLSHTHLLRLVAGNLKNDLVHSGRAESTAHSQWRRLDRVLIHPQFYFPTNDIALVYVGRPWRFTRAVHAIPPASVHGDYGGGGGGGGACRAAGFGSTHVGVRPDALYDSPVMLVGEVRTLSHAKCSQLWGMNMKTFICSESLLADVGEGDSGGPLACSGTGDPAARGGAVLVGVVSGKNFDKSTLYTRVSAYHDWITRSAASPLSLHSAIILIYLIYLLFYLHFRSVFQIST